VRYAASGDEFPVHRIYCVGRNYTEHALEMGATGRELPFFFMKPADAVLPAPHASAEPPDVGGLAEQRAQGSAARMPYPSLTHSLHHEVELVVAIGRGGRNIPAAQALDHVWGYAVGLDMTRRDLQAEMKKQGRPWCIAKGFDQSAPISAIVPTAQCTLRPESVIELSVNGQLRQSSRIDKMIWSVPEIIEHVSAAWELVPGDLIFTGTPEGVGEVRPGDTLRARLEGVGALEVQVTAA
jgi:fumarylpyruvate hydrolase